MLPLLFVDPFIIIFMHDASQETFLILLQYYFLISVKCLSNVVVFPWVKLNNYGFSVDIQNMLDCLWISKIIWIFQENPKDFLDFHGYPK